MSVGHGDDFHTIDGSPKDDEVRKPSEQNPPRCEVVFRLLLGIRGNARDRAVHLVKEQFGSPSAALPNTSRLQPQLPPRLRDEFGQVQLSPLQPRPEAPAGVLPRHQLNGATVDLPKTAMDLLPPSLFSAIVDCMIKAPDQRIDQSGTSLSGKVESIS